MAVLIAELQRPVKGCKGTLSLMRGKENWFPKSPSFNLRLVGWLRRWVEGLGGGIPVTTVSINGRKVDLIIDQLPVRAPPSVYDCGNLNGWGKHQTVTLRKQSAERRVNPTPLR